MEDTEHSVFLIKELSQNYREPFNKSEVLSILDPEFYGTILLESPS